MDFSSSDGPPTCPCCGQHARLTICQPCRLGEHLDHLGGVRDFANPLLRGDPTLCVCPFCAPAELEEEQ